MPEGDAKKRKAYAIMNKLVEDLLLETHSHAPR